MKDEFQLTERDKRLLLSLARVSIQNKLTRARQPLPPRTPSVDVRAGAFVTLRVRGPEPKLRGCIGHIVPNDSLYDTVREVAVSSAVSDPRFPPLTASELADVEIEISVLSPLRTLGSLDEIEPGRHGLLIKRGYASGLLLPQVATEHGWDRETFVRHTCLKAGLPPGCEEQDDVELSVFTALVFDEGSFRV